MESMMGQVGSDHGGLDPSQDPARWEALVGSIVRAAEPELIRRGAASTVTATLLAWARPALSAAATVALLLTASLAVSRGVSAGGDAEPSLAGAVVSEELAAWLVGDYRPTVTEVVVALEEIAR
jgi:hypothetical protein